MMMILPAGNEIDDKGGWVYRNRVMSHFVRPPSSETVHVPFERDEI